jgi:hypothetical protein
VPIKTLGHSHHRKSKGFARLVKTEGVVKINKSAEMQKYQGVRMMLLIYQGFQKEKVEIAVFERTAALTMDLKPRGH